MRKISSREGFRKTNHLAVAGFLLPFAAAGLAGALVLAGGDFREPGYSLLYLTLVPTLLLTGLMSSLRSIPRIPALGDRDYAYSGLTLNLLFLGIYLVSLIYFISAKSPAV